jgi:hypothetical protein
LPLHEGPCSCGGAYMTELLRARELRHRNPVSRSSIGGIRTIKERAVRVEIRRPAMDFRL